MTGVSQNGNYIYNAGRYEFHVISGITGSNVVLSVDAGDFSPGTERVQLIRVPSYKSARVTGVLTCDAWNGTTGGVLVLLTEGTLVLESDIDVSAKGFRGAGLSGSSPYSGCVYYTGADYPAENTNAAGYKGEGNVTQSILPRGKGRAWNGGGGGNGIYAGGGGGGNGGKGGQGGISVCSDFDNIISAEGGDYYKRYEEGGGESWVNRLFPGGGGGSGTGNNTHGGNGGGLVILAAQKIEFANEAKIIANGGDVVEGDVTVGNLKYASGGAGGGGGGGTVLLSAVDISVAPNRTTAAVEAKGGKGGNAANYNCKYEFPTSGSYGIGGGGGGGLVFLQHDITGFVRLDSGKYGELRVNTCILYNSHSQKGRTESEFELQLKGFVHNYILMQDTALCNNVSTTIRASEPQGGGDTYVYVWQRASDRNGPWTTVDSARLHVHYATPQLASGTYYYRRIVRAQQTIGGTTRDVRDISMPVKINVVTPISNNILTTRDTTVCGDLPSLQIEGLSATGATGNFIYRWETSVESGQWTLIPEAVGPDYTVPVAVGAHKYRRIAVAQDDLLSCSIASNEVSMNVFPVIGNNIVTPVPAAELCEGTPVTLEGGIPLGGNDVYNYRWQAKIAGTWTDMSNTDKDLQAGGHIGDRYFRRIITSGMWNCCMSVSDSALVRYHRMPSDAIAGADQIWNFKFKLRLDATPVSVGIGTWESADSTIVFNNSANPSAQVSLPDTGRYTIRWVVSNGAFCPVKSDEVTLTVRDIYVPDGFSPNGDGYNDCFGVLGIDNAENFELIIINRNNKVVYSTSSISGGYPYPCLWNGKNTAGKELPADTYYYRLITNANRIKKGYVTLRK
ncbi:MAG: gliding motility-associated C-terminal domain-containing protein [Bacteroidales bacterium]|nr:gliding motility-associated C-terminal domain-containing protein [Bacteroidales bacterium]